MFIDYYQDEHEPLYAILHGAFQLKRHGRWLSLLIRAFKTVTLKCDTKMKADLLHIVYIVSFQFATYTDHQQTMYHMSFTANIKLTGSYYPYTLTITIK